MGIHFDLPISGLQVCCLHFLRRLWKHSSNDDSSLSRQIREQLNMSRLIGSSGIPTDLPDGYTTGTRWLYDWYQMATR